MAVLVASILPAQAQTPKASPKPFVVVQPGPLPDDPGRGGLHLELSTPSLGQPTSSRPIKSTQTGQGNYAVKAARATPVGHNVLKNGVRVLVTESPEENIVAVEILIGVGLIDENTPVTGITNLIQEILSDRISQDSNLKDRLEASGTTLKMSAEPDYARISLQTTAKEFPTAFGWIGSALRQRKTTPEELERVRNRMVKDIKEGGGGAFAQLYEIFRQTFYRYHPYRQTGKGSEIAYDRWDSATIDTFMDKYYAGNRIVVSIAGRVDRTQALELAKKELGSIPSTEIKQVEITWEPKAQEKEIYLTGGRNIAWLFVGFPAPAVASRDYVAMKLVEAIMGDGLSSRLFTEIREKRSLAYELGAMYPMLKGPSHMLTYTITKPEDVGAARRELLRQIEKLKKDGVGQVELGESRLKVIGNYLLERETNSGKAFNLALAEIIGVGYEFDQSFIHEVETVTPQEIQDVAQRYLDNYTLVVARPGGRFYFDF